ncbi:MAG: 3-hydroxyacyl-CoA dehydrogenase / enoyl-CoA hydratase / 3-hydroxybutyryl-CoA epimerase [Chthoniobacter sp.]|jgi:3-hydroxyacyl-CoA dehydrogenase/enoyl-CoA hydratase/3-hydroxybutyryl-CoA epimerase|nr:3-hydroxyacyl-CoA dehydrogenase / enoyl-CoA hydratase / 3-hydroxybutyryl-CoA epimerase [Chthoniobacter sp.]
MPNLRHEINDDRICVVTFDRPDSSANIFDRATLNELGEQVDALAGNEQIAGVVFMSAKPSIFIAGADLNALQNASETELEHFIELGQSVFKRLAALKMPTIAAIHGACVGGGYEMCLACDYRIATPDRATKIGLPETKLGILPAWGGSTRLPRLIGVPRALDIILGGKTPAAKQALRLGLIDALAPREYLLRAASRVIAHGLPRRHKRSWQIPFVSAAIASVISPFVRAKLQRKTRGHYPALPKALEVVAGAPSVWNENESFARERVAVLELARTEAARNLLRIFRLQERAKKLTVAPTAVSSPHPDEKKVVVIGAGVMGAAIAQWLSARGQRVVLRDIDADRVAAGMARIARLYDSGVKRRRLERREARDGMDRISPAATEVPLHDADLVIEAAVEKMDLKKQIFTRFDEVAGAQTVLATNTSALSVSELASATKNPGRVVGIHFFNPVHQMQLVEVVTGRETSNETIQRAVAFVQRIGKLPVVVRDSPGFLVNRILLPYLVEAGHFFEMGATAADIDEAMLDFGMPMGPLRLIDEVGLDIAVDVAATLAAKFPDRMRVPTVLTKMMGAGMLGRKSGRGFYVHSKNGEVTPNREAAEFRASEAAEGLERMELQRRMVLLMVNEAARCLEEKVVAEAADVDFGMIMGAGFAPFRGGPLRFADASGLSEICGELAHLVEVGGPHFAPCELLSQMAASGKKFYEAA